MILCDFVWILYHIIVSYTYIYYTRYTSFTKHYPLIKFIAQKEQQSTVKSRISLLTLGNVAKVSSLLLKNNTISLNVSVCFLSIICSGLFKKLWHLQESLLLDLEYLFTVVTTAIQSNVCGLLTNSLSFVLFHPNNLPQAPAAVQLQSISLALDLFSIEQLRSRLFRDLNILNEAQPMVRSWFWHSKANGVDD